MTLHRYWLRLSTLFLGALYLSGQETHFQTRLQSGDATFSFDASALSATGGATMTVRNAGSSNISFPAIWNYGSTPPLGASEIVAPLKAAATSDEDFAIKAWNFVLDHATHFCSAGSPSLYASDPMQILYADGVGCCDQTSRVLAWLWSAAGYNVRIAVMTFHTVPELYYGGEWHMLDPDHRTFYRDAQAAIASVEEIFANPRIVADNGDGSGKDPVGSLNQAMADLYVANASSLTYASIPTWPDNGAQYSLAGGESAEFRTENPMPSAVFYPIAGYNPPYSGAFGSIVFRRRFDFTANGLSLADASTGVERVTETDGRKALTTESANGSITFRKTSPFPILSLKLKGEFFIAGSTDSISIQVSKDGAAWTNPVPIPINFGAAPNEYSVDMSQFAFGWNTVSVRILLNGPSNSVQIFSLDLETLTQFSQKMFPALQAGEVNTFSYHDQSPPDQPRAVDVEVATTHGSRQLGVASATSLIPENTQYSIALNYGARNLIDGTTATLAYPASSNIDYVLTLQRQSHVNQMSLWWGEFGTNPVYVKKWTVYGRNGSRAPWVVLSQGGFPNAAISDITLDTTVTDLRITAVSDNWIGIYMAKVYGDESTPPASPTQLTTTSQIPENPIYSLAHHYGAANLTDGNPQTLAYPGSVNVDYIVSLNGLSHLSGATITWGYFGTDPAYVQSWSLLGRNGSGSWTLLSSGGFPGATVTNISLNALATDVRIVASSTTNWIGIYELQLDASKIINPSAIASDIPLNGDSALPTANLCDGNASTLAYPGNTALDYQVDLGSDSLVDGAVIDWEGFGTNPIYIQSWEILGQRDQENVWTPVSGGRFPNSTKTWADIHRMFRRLRIRATSSNWIGVYELSVYGTRQ
jgi:hypothetical protein